MTVAVTNVSKEQHPHLQQFNECFFFHSCSYQVDCQADRANDEDQLYIFDLLHLHEPLHRIDKDGEAESNKKDALIKAPTTWDIQKIFLTTSGHEIEHF